MKEKNSTNYLVKGIKDFLLWQLGFNPSHPSHLSPYIYTPLLLTYFGKEIINRRSKEE
jgi:hypothetical protein